MNTTERILAAREGASVERVHTAPHLGTYSVGAHSHGITMLLIILHPDPSAALYKAAAVHDIAERWTGDVPGYILRVDPALRAEVKRAEKDHAKRLGLDEPSLTADEAMWLKALDTFELWLWCRDQYALGNQHVCAIEEDVRIWLETSESVPSIVRDAYREYNRLGWRRLRHADLPEAPANAVLGYDRRCTVCASAGRKAHIGQCTVFNLQSPNATGTYQLHQPEATYCGCCECQHGRDEAARRNSSGATR